MKDEASRILRDARHRDGLAVCRACTAADEGSSDWVSRAWLLCFHGSSCRKNVGGLRDLGWVEGKNIVIESRWAEGNYDRLPELASELVRLNVDVLVTYGTPGVLAAKQATTIIPIVMVSSPTRSDPASSPASAGPGGTSPDKPSLSWS